MRISKIIRIFEQTIIRIRVKRINDVAFEERKIE